MSVDSMSQGTHPFHQTSSESSNSRLTNLETYISANNSQGERIKIALNAEPVNKNTQKKLRVNRLASFGYNCFI